MMLEDYKEREAESKQENETMAAEINTQASKLNRNEQEIERLERDLAKLQAKYRNDVSSVEKEVEGLRKRSEELESQQEQQMQRLRNAEIDNDNYERQMRESDYTIQDLEQKLESNMEQLALLQWELEEYKIHTQEQLERLNQQKKETETELKVKESMINKLKTHILQLES